MDMVMRNGSLFLAAVFACLVSGVSAETGFTKDGTVLRFEVEQGDTLQWTDPFPADATAFFKTGLGTLEISSDNASFKGSADIVAGTVKILHRNALGSSTDAAVLTDGAISVSNGAQLATFCPKAAGQTDKVISKRLVLAGSGPSGTGALRLGTQTGYQNQDSYLAYIELADNALIVNTDTSRYGFCAIDPQGRKLSTTGENSSGAFIFYGCRCLTSGTIVYSKLQTVWQNGVTFAGGAEGRIRLEDGASLRLYSGENRTVCPWTLEFAGSKQLSVSVRNDWLNTFTGPVEINAAVYVTGGAIRFSGDVSGTGTLSAFGTQLDLASPVTRRSGSIVVGYFEKSPATPAVLRLGEGSVVSNSVEIGASAGRIGAIHQTGGTVVNTATGYKNIGGDNGAYGYYGLNGGALGFGKYWRIGQNTGSVGVMEIAAGAVAATSGPLCIGNGGWGEIRMTGGSFKYYGSEIGAEETKTGGCATITLSGTGNPEFLLPWGTAACLTPATNNSSVTVNLNAGHFVATSIVKLNHQDMKPGAKAFLNFNGGAWESLYTSQAIFGTGNTALDRVTVFAGGATARMAYSSTQAADTPLVRPSGRGVASIELPEGVFDEVYAGPPEVRISGGGGEGATAHALYDPQTRKITGIEVTCPGWDYESVPRVTVCSADRTVTNECIAVLTPGEQRSGGLTVEGTHTLTLKAVNTYGGDTVLKGSATLKIAAPGALPADSTVVFAGGTLENNSGVKHMKYAVDCADALAANGFEFHGNIDFSGGVTIDIRNSAEFPREAKKTKLVAFLGSVTGTPVVTGIDSVMHKASFKGNVLEIANRTGAVIVLR